MPAKNRIGKPARRLAKSEINVTPLIDVLLVLLVIFMVVTPLRPTGLGASIPQPARQGEEPAAEEAIVLSMNRAGAIRINQEPVELPGLAPRLIEIFKTRSDHTVFVQADSELEFNEVVQMIDAAKGAGANRVGLMTAEIAPK